MNFFDSYDVPGTATPPPAAQQSLNEEVSEVMGQLRGFWGGFRKQSVSLLDTARKDLTSVVSQAQQELSKLTVSEPEPAAASGEQPPASSENSEADEHPEAGPSSPPTPEGDASISSAEGSPRPNHARSTSQPFQFFSKLQSSLPPNLLETVQKNIPEQLRTAPSSVDFAQLRTTLSSEFQRVQGLTRAQAEEYVHKSEELLKEVAKEAGEFLKEAVKVVPPEEVREGGTGVVWDGSDVWMLPEPGQGKGKGKEREASGSGRRASSETLRAVATRAEAMLKMLRRDPSVVRMDPEGEERIRELYVNWVKSKLEATEGGIGDEEWKAKREKELADEVDGTALKETFETLVPSEMTEETFWTRYFFRVYQIEHEEEMRRTLLMGSTQNEEDFSWEDDDEEPAKRETPSAPPSTAALESDKLQPNEKKTTDTLSAPISRAGTPGNVSPRVSSEDSFDVVSSNVSASGEAPVKAGEGEKKSTDDEDPDSDWE
ncbi:hypothetical protein GLOTRDRAFT_137686 [Gloeophyllum trabeum ATCC 11539]|uniref:BSD domain-containing protein n=1 Tax=Gloeophyllum trabeum (strain ATCC 11539 / FP-39264 / Madison 617) TaxID=670483 RepID=S7QDC6_GLOTA|nr:uncharacterized protein GLOTRDRAFT_137686 [Gloeophyllum trabeum ATCC 11539]EPQ57337.1 hypothetical protein GLOTRDRAFT_137686 [Gloeophyllum trabeum ATCC 11539]